MPSKKIPGPPQHRWLRLPDGKRGFYYNDAPYRATTMLVDQSAPRGDGSSGWKWELHQQSDTESFLLETGLAFAGRQIKVDLLRKIQQLKREFPNGKPM